MENKIDLPNTRIITVSGRIASGSTTLARKISERLGWKHMEGGEIFWENVRGKLKLSPKDTNLRPDTEDQLFDDSLKKILKEDKDIVLETKLAGYFAKDIKDVFKILVLCDDADGTDQTQIRIDRLVNREQMSMLEAKTEVLEREKNDVEKWRRLYAKNDLEWNYWNDEYYDIVINSFFHDPEESLNMAIEAIGVKR
ncbi:MAG TPA: cytidylate kinase family protein [Candidatus Limnocylindrales bacterium]|nr:cytidylate kinase family protein [Candidatus Limnocylindrales bacterium]